MFRALIVLFVTTAHQPMGLAVGEFPDRFKDLGSCEAFLDKKRKEIAASTHVTLPGDNHMMRVVGREFSCVRDTRGGRRHKAGLTDLTGAHTSHAASP